MDLRNSGEFVLAEYATLREEISSAYGYAQGNVRWTITTYGALFSIGLLAISTFSGNAGSLAAGLVAITNLQQTTAPVLLYVLLSLYGLVIPALVWVGTWLWLGELLRAERASAYLRGLEQQVAQEVIDAANGTVAPLRWERFIVSHRGSQTAWGRIEAASFAIAIMMGAATAISLVLFLYLIVQLANNVGAIVLLSLAALTIEICGVAMTVRIYRGLSRLALTVSDIPSNPEVPRN